MRTLVLAALFAAATASSAGATVVGTMQLNGNTAIVTDDHTSPGPGYTMLGCGVRSDGKQACTWVVASTAPAPAAPAPVVASAPPPPAPVNVAQQGNPMIGGVQPDGQVACQTGDGSFRCANVQPKATAYDWARLAVTGTILGLAVTHNGGGFCCSTGGYVGGSYVPPDAVFSHGGAPRQ